MANRRPGSIGSGSTGSTSRSLDPKAQRDVDALLGISRRDPPRDKNRDKSREKIRDAQPPEQQPREHGRSILGSSLFKRSAKKDKGRDDPPSAQEPTRRNVLQRHSRPSDNSMSPAGSQNHSGSSLSISARQPVSPRSVPILPGQQYQPPLRTARDVPITSEPRLPDLPLTDSSASDLSMNRQLQEQQISDGVGVMRLRHATQQVGHHAEHRRVDLSSEAPLRRKHRPQDLDLSQDQPLPHARHSHTLYPQMSPYADGRVEQGSLVELDRQMTESSTSMPYTPDSVGRPRRSREISPRFFNQSPKYPPSTHSYDRASSIASREPPASTHSQERAYPPTQEQQPPPREVVDPESEDDEQGDVLSFAQATAGLGPDIGFNAPQPLTVSYPSDEHLKSPPHRALPYRPAAPPPNTLETPPTTTPRPLASSHNVSPIQRPVSQLTSPVPEMWLNSSSTGIGIPPSRHTSTRRLSFISVLEDDPPPRPNDDELPDYAASQAQAQAAGRAEAARRARELQRRWQQSGQQRGGT